MIAVFNVSSMVRRSRLNQPLPLQPSQGGGQSVAAKKALSKVVRQAQKVSLNADDVDIGGYAIPEGRHDATK